MNGGSCVEQCENPKEKFKCECPAKYSGKVCQERKYNNSCIDILKTSYPPGAIPANGRYAIIRTDTKTTLPVYCAFDSPNQAWTLIESFSLANNYLFKREPFHKDYPRNNLVANWDQYRLSLSDMQYVRSKATMFRATCDYPNRASLTPDFLLGQLQEYDLLGGDDINNICIKFSHIDIMGSQCFNCTAAAFHAFGTTPYHFHLDLSVNKYCQFKSPLIIIASDTDNFGFYGTTNPKSKCTATQQSTTQWWLGE
jgi:hypothetical protein